MLKFRLFIIGVLTICLSYYASAQSNNNVILKPYKSFASQIKESGRIYHIQYDFNLNNRTVVIPNNCTLVFEGGSIRNGTLDLNECRIEGVGVKCRIKNPGDYSYTLSHYLADTTDHSLNRDVVQTLLDEQIPVIFDIPQLVFSAPLLISSYSVVKSASDKRIVLHFPDSKGFVWDKKVYSQNNLFQGLYVIAKDNCFDFVNGGDPIRPYNVYFSTFRNLKAQSLEGNCFYSGVDNYGASGDDCTFDNLFEDIEVVAPKGSGFVGLSSNTQHFIKIRCIECGIAFFYNCSGVFDSCNGTWGNTPTFFKGTRRAIDKPARYTCIFRNCNIESYKSVLFSCKDPLCYMELSIEDCSFYISPNDKKVIDYFPFDFDYLFSLRMRNNKFYRLSDGKYDSTHTLFRIGYYSSDVSYCDIDQDIHITDNNVRCFLIQGNNSNLRRVDERPAHPMIGECFFDTVIGKPLWWNGNSWVEANGKVQ